MRATISRVLGAVLLVLLGASVTWAQTGKISGVVTDAQTGEPLPGVNVVIVGEQQGATTDAQGRYSILNLSPGTYDVRASFVGFANATREGVDVNIDLTTQVNFEMQEETQELQEVTVQAEERVVKPDISANVANISADNVENVPVSSLSEVVGLQAGVQGLSVRGGDLNELSIRVNGLSMRDGRSNEPTAAISYTSIKEVQVQTGGFNAEYGNVRSGLINVVTKDAPRDFYTVDVFTRYTPNNDMSFGPRPDDPDSYWLRPYLDEDVAFQGTAAGWDRYTQRQYPEFEGFNTLSEKFNNDDNPNNDLSPTQLQDLFKWYRRKDLTIQDHSYVIDGTIGGPIPGGSYLGDLRFLASYRQNQDPYIIPQSYDSQMNRMGQLKLTANITPAMKLQFQGLYQEQHGLNPTNEGWPEMMDGGSSMAYSLGSDASIFANHNWSQMDVTRQVLGVEFTHSISANTFYNVRLQRNSSDYWTRPGRHRDKETIVNQIGPRELDEAPFGYDSTLTTTPTGMWLGGNYAWSRDDSWSKRWSGSFDITSQLNSFSQLKAGADYIYTIHRSDHRQDHALFWQGGGDPVFIWKRYPRQGAVYAQNKLEFEGLIANVGLRLDYFDAGGMWFDADPFDTGYSSVTPHPDQSIEKRPTDPRTALSPRLGLSFPISVDSKFFFNYGHFRQLPDPDRIYMIREIFSGKITEVGNPNQPMPKTISYELGYEQSIADAYLLRLNGYYKDITEQPRNVGFHDISGLVDYSKPLPHNYEDVRGFEATLRKVGGQWIRGFANFTFMARKQGNFGLGQIYENPVEQRQYIRTSTENVQFKPVPQPYARASITLLGPQEFGPALGSLRPLGDWRLSFLGSWSAGDVFTWSGSGNVPEIRNNVRWADDWNLDARLTKNFSIGGADASFFVDASNVLNIKRLNRYSGFEGANDFTNYMKSLHLSESVFDAIDSAPYSFVPGNDEPGDYREAGAEFVPIEVVENTSSVSAPHSRPLYYESSSADYFVWEGGSWQQADEGRVDEVLDKKAYIDMPNGRSFSFLNPRRFQIGLRFSF